MAEILRVPFVIVGGGIAGVSCVEQLAFESPSTQILLISATPHIKAVTNVKKFMRIAEEFDVEEQPSSTLNARYPNVQIITDHVVSLFAKDHLLQLSSGQSIIYEKLCICAGGSPKVISQTSPFVVGIRDINTIQSFKEKLSNARRVMVVGNGGIATELVYEIENCEIIWAIKNKHISSTFFDCGAAEFFATCLSKDKTKTKETIVKRMKYALEDVKSPVTQSCSGSALGPDWSSDVDLKGILECSRTVNVQYDCEVKSIYTPEELSSMGKTQDSAENWPVYVELTNSAIFGCDMIVSATGVEPCTKVFLPNNKLALADDGGLKVNNQMQTSEDDVYAAGDVCTPAWHWSKRWFQMRLWTQARQMGAYAAKCIVAKHEKKPKVTLDICFDLFTHVTRFFGYKVVLLGLFNGQNLGTDCEILLRVTMGEEYVKVIMQEGKMQGAILIGDTDLEETFENLTLCELNLSYLGVDLLNPAVDIEDYFD